MNKIVIEVTSNGWETTATINGKSIKRSMLQQHLDLKVLKVILKAKMIYRKKYMTL